MIPECYAKFRVLFITARACTLPPHRPHECATKLLSDTTPPRSWILAIAHHIKIRPWSCSEAIQQGYFRPSTFPKLAGLFYIYTEKREGGLHLCIDYSGLKQHTVKYRYALFSNVLGPGIAQQPASSTSLMFKVEEFRNLIRIRKSEEWKTAFSINLEKLWILKNTTVVIWSPVKDLCSFPIARSLVELIFTAINKLLWLHSDVESQLYT